jgi:hypothetical protein
MKACEIKSVYFPYHVLMVSGGNFMKGAQDKLITPKVWTQQQIK